MTPTAFLFPGQGAQYVGMAKDLYDARAEVRAAFDAAVRAAAAPVDVREAAFSGPEDVLARTDVSQPAILAHSLAVLALLPRVLVPAAAAGLSLGEYVALVAAGSLSPGDAARIVGQRGALMQRACERTRGGMASILGLDPAAVAEACAEAGGVVGISNYNSPAQTVIAGEAEALSRAVERCKARGAKRAIPLTVAGAYHSPLMAEAAGGLAPVLADVEIRTPCIPFVSNVTGKVERDPETIRDLLVKQVVSAVRWTDCCRTLAGLGFKKAVELGPGTVLKGLFRQIDRTVEVESVGTLAEVGGLAASIGGVGKQA